MARTKQARAAWARRLRELLPRRRRRSTNPFTSAGVEGLDLSMAPPYDMTDEIRDELREEVEEHLQRLLPDAVDAYSGDVLDHWADARAAQFVARLDAERDERKAVNDALIGMAREDVARLMSRYDADLARVQQAEEALELTRHRLTGKAERTPTPAVPTDSTQVASTLGRILQFRPTQDGPVNGHPVPLPRSGHRNGNGSPVLGDSSPVMTKMRDHDPREDRSRDDDHHA